MSKLMEWVNETPERAAGFAQEGLILEVSEEIHRVLTEKLFAKADLAAGLKCSKSHVTQLLNGQRNLTLRTLADICRVLGVKPEFRLVTDKERKGCDSCPYASGKQFEYDCGYPECVS